MSLHRDLLEWRRNPNICMSSIIMRNENVPSFEEIYGKLDYDWLLKVVGSRQVITTDPLIIRHINGRNLSLDSDYRKQDYYEILKILDGDVPAMQRLAASRARYFYVMRNPGMVRHYLWQSKLTLKNVLYYITSYSSWIMGWVIKHFNVFG